MAGTTYGRGFVITPSDTQNFAQPCVGIYIGGGSGALSVVTLDEQTLVFAGLVTGSILPVQAKRVNAAGTTATSLIGLLTT